MATEQEILRYIGRQTKHVATFKQIAQDFAVRGRGRRQLQQVLLALTRGRKLMAIGKDRWSLPSSAAKQDLLMGRLRMHRDGFGFVIPEQDSVPAQLRGKLHGDIFVPPPAIGNAMHGDQVLVELVKLRHDGRAEGHIVRVMEREQETVVGLFHYGHKYNYVTPIDEKIAMEIVI
ncbi:MAG TPA: ribonuclease R, partial [Candidatus Angelobacter sp.]|nr:ribonuclease R [Candidatus Angelobacter sp.]